MRSISSRMIHSVRMARFRTEVNATSMAMFSRRRSRPPSAASRCPVAVKSTSVHPVKRFSRFQMLWPWRTRMSFPGTLGSTIDGVIEDERREAFGGARRVRKIQRGLGELELKDTRRGIGIADQIHARIQRGGKRNGAERPFAGAQLIKLRHARGNVLGRKELASRTLPAAQQGPLADGMAERAAEIDEC